MTSFISKNLSKILSNKDDVEKFYSDVLDNSIENKEFRFKNNEDIEFTVSFVESSD